MIPQFTLYDLIIQQFSHVKDIKMFVNSEMKYDSLMMITDYIEKKVFSQFEMEGRKQEFDIKNKCNYLKESNREFNFLVNDANFCGMINRSV